MTSKFKVGDRVVVVRYTAYPPSCDFTSATTVAMAIKAVYTIATVCPTYYWPEETFANHDILYDDMLELDWTPPAQMLATTAPALDFNDSRGQNWGAKASEESIAKGRAEDCGTSLTPEARKIIEDRIAFKKKYGRM